jgi:hypothetical protein
MMRMIIMMVGMIIVMMNESIVESSVIHEKIIEIYDGLGGLGTSPLH